MEDKGDAEGKDEPAAAVRVEGRNAADGPQVPGRRGMTTDQGGVGMAREPVGAKGGGSQGRADMSAGQDGAKRSKAGGRATGSSSTRCMTCGSTS